MGHKAFKMQFVAWLLGQIKIDSDRAAGIRQILIFTGILDDLNRYLNFSTIMIMK